MKTLLAFIVGWALLSGHLLAYKGGSRSLSQTVVSMQRLSDGSKNASSFWLVVSTGTVTDLRHVLNVGSRKISNLDQYGNATGAQIDTYLLRQTPPIHGGAQK